MRNEIEELKASGATGKNDSKEINSLQNQKAYLGVNIPNPFGPSTIIPLSIPGNCRSAQLMISETSTGKIVSVMELSCDQTFVNIESGDFQNGMYSYALFVDEALVASRQMVVARL